MGANVADYDVAVARGDIVIKKWLVAMMAVLVTGLGVGLLAPASASAAIDYDEDCNSRFLTFPAWYNNLAKVDPNSGKCAIVTDLDEEDLPILVWVIVLNILSILFSLVGYLAIGFLIFGSYLYILARGDTTRIARGKSTIIRSLIGLVICILASLLSNTIVNIITGAAAA